MADVDYASALARRVASCSDALVPFASTAYRATSPKYANARNLLSGVGSGEGGGRWNPRGIKATYLACDIDTTVAELRRFAVRVGFAEEDVLPQTLCAIRARLRAVLDLTDGRIRQRLRYSYDDMVGEDWWRLQDAGEQPWTQFLGQQAFECGYEGLVAPSSAKRPDGRVLVVFPDNLARDSALRIANADQLIDPASGTGPRDMQFCMQFA